MALIPGVKLGPYQIQSPLGAGGMGEVYRALDTRLGREVAIKILPPEFSQDPLRKQRFEREAKAISALNHPNICTLYDVGNQEGMEYLVMELLGGESLADRLAKGPLPLKEATSAGAQIADGLERAHRSGIVHRDLKPGNIMLTKSGAKLLDFGLARESGLVQAAVVSGSIATTRMPEKSPMTQDGVVVGTFQYMSPEQLEGKEVDSRSDIFSFGAVLYEMVTGRRAFEGKSQLSVMSAILEKDPEPITNLKPLTPAILDRTIRKCLEKEPEQRWQNASDLATQLRWLSDVNSTTLAAQTLESGRDWKRIAVLLVGLLLIPAVASVAWLVGKGPATGKRVMRFSINVPAGDALGGSWWWYPTVAISQDGSQIAYVAHRGGASQIYLRAIGDSTPHPVAGTEGGDAPFFSPDGQWLGFSAEGKLKKLPVAGSAAVTVTNTGVSGACWARDGMIYYAPSDGSDSGLFKVAANGGQPQRITSLNTKNNEVDQRYPELLPSGKALIFVTRTATEPSFDEADITALSIASGEQKVLIKGGTDPHYVTSGHLLFVRAGVLLAVPFDADRLEVKGAAVPVADSVLENPRIGAGQYAVSRDGTLVYIPGGITYGEHELVFVGKSGNERSVTGKKRPYEDFTISPNGHFIATTIEGPVTDTWIHDLDRDTETRFTFGVENRDPTWTPDGKHVAYSGFRDGKYRVWWRPTDGGGGEETLIASNLVTDAWFFTPDGRGLLYAEYGSGKGQNIGLLPLDDREHRHLLFPQEYDVEWAVLSPDGKYIAFNGDESGQSEVYVAPYPNLAPRERISTEGGMHPLWSPDGRELYYRAGSNMQMENRALAQRTRIMAVSIETKPTLKAGHPRMLFEGPYFTSGHDIAVTPDGRGFILIRENESTGPSAMSVVVHWFAELIQKVPTGN